MRARKIAHEVVTGAGVVERVCNGPKIDKVSSEGLFMVGLTVSG